MTRRQWELLNRRPPPRAVALPRDKHLAAWRRLALTALAALGLLTLAGVLAPSAHAADVRVKVWVNGCPKDFNPPAIQRNGVTYVPLRQGVEAVGAKLKWDKAADKAVITANGKTVRIGKSQGLMVKGALLIPLRLVSQALDCRVAWDAGAKSVRLTMRQSVPTVPT